MYVSLLLIFIAVLLRDSMSAPLLGETGAGWTSVASLGLLGGLWLTGHLMIWREGRRLDRRGDMRALRRADQAAMFVRLGAVAVHIFNVLVLGWLDAVRSVTGDLIVIDELLAAAPALTVFALSWWSMYPLERRLREAVVLQELEIGRPVRPMLPGRGMFVVSALRHQVAMVLVPVTLIIAWNELVERGAMRYAPPVWVPLFLQVFGIAVVLTMMPLVLRRVWDTVALAPGPLREQIAAMCRRHRVRVRELLVWRTHGTMVNGAVMGIAGPLRYILLTDALLDHLHPEQVEAVTAHEIGHVRRRHIPWLLGGIIATIILATVVLQTMLVWVAGSWLQPGIIDAATGMGAIVGAFLLFGFASRRFEWQADAFAAQHLSGYSPGQAPAETVVVTSEAVQAMTGALERVAVLNHIRRNRFTWRHGSIASRQRRLKLLVGHPADRLKPDRDAAVIKVLSAAAMLAAAGVLVLDLFHH
jgi:STE24 endopeptidase